MTRALLAFILLMSTASVASADGYQDFNAGVAAASRMAREPAIKSLSAAIAAPDLPAHLRPAAYAARGNEYATLLQYDAAIADYTQAIALKPDWPDPYLLRCGVYSAKKMFDRALVDCSYAVQLQPQNIQLHRVRVALYLHLKNFDDAIADYSTIIAARPTDTQLLFDRSVLYQLRGDFYRALADTNSAAGLLPKSDVPDLATARIYFAQGNFPKAIEADDSAIAKSPNDNLSYLAKGQALWAMGRYDEAAQGFQESLRRFSLQPYSFAWLSIVEYQLHGKVPADITERFAANHQVAILGEALVQLFLGKMKPEEMLQLKGEDTATGEDLPCTANFFVGEWYLTQGDTAGARRSLQSAVDFCPPYSGMHQSATVELGRLH
jgi:lipoprotein NlpI